MAPKYMSYCVKLPLTLTVLLMFVILTASTKQCTSKKMERGGYVIKNIGIKLCQLKCAEYGQCVSIKCDTETLTCRLSRSEAKIEKKEEHAILARSNSHVPTGSCTSGKCSFGQRCLKTRSGKEVCVQASTDPSTNPVPPAPMPTQDTDPQGRWETPTVNPSQARPSDLHDASNRGNLDTVKRILAGGHVDINTRGTWGKTPVMKAAQWGRRDVVEFLVCRGADVSLVDNFGNNILHLACKGGDLEIVKLILSLNKVDINTRTNDGTTAADLARFYGLQQVLDLLVSRGAH